VFIEGNRHDTQAKRKLGIFWDPISTMRITNLKRFLNPTQGGTNLKGSSTLFKPPLENCNNHHKVVVEEDAQPNINQKPLTKRKETLLVGSL
jgi:hypothetical protein